MAYLRRRTRGKQTYLYIVESRRRAGIVRQVTLEYLGNASEVAPARLKRALTYWGVGAKRKARKGGGNRT
jgi:hypothetical protein